MITAAWRELIRNQLAAVPIALAASLMLITAAAAQVTTPPRGSPLRAQLMDALRPMVEAEVGKPVEFVVIDLNVLGEWAFAHVRPQRPGGGAIPYVYSRYQAAVDAGVFEGTVMALLRQTPAGWLVYQYSLGATDIPYVDWPSYYPVPIDIFPVH